MIETEILSNAIREYFKSKIDNEMQMIDIAEANAEIQKIIEQLEKDGCWSPVDEGVPNDGRYVLLSFENFNLPLVGRYEEDEDGGGAFYVGDDDICCGNYELFVNAWMELPKAYKAKELDS